MKVFRTDKLVLAGYLSLILAYCAFFTFILARLKVNLLFFSFVVILFLPFAVYAFSLLARRVEISEDAITVRGLTGKKKIRWNEITDVHVARGRRFMLFISGKSGDTIILDDFTERFKELVEEIKSRIPGNAIPGDLSDVRERSPVKPVVLILASAFLLYAVIKNLF